MNTQTTTTTAPASNRKARRAAAAEARKAADASLAAQAAAQATPKADATPKAPKQPKAAKAPKADGKAAGKPDSHRAYYKAGFIDNWHADTCGPAPALNLFDVVHAIAPDKNPGVEALHIAMCLRPNGCTVREFMIAGNCGPANNYRKSLVAVARVITVTKLPGEGGRGYRFKAALTAEGVKRVKAALGDVPKALTKAGAADATA